MEGGGEKGGKGYLVGVGGLEWGNKLLGLRKRFPVGRVRGVLGSPGRSWESSEGP